MLLPLVLGVILGGVSVIFIAQNTSLVTVTFLSWQFESSLAVVLLFTIASGILMALLFLLPSLIRDAFYVSAIKKRKNELEDEISETRRTLADASVPPTKPDVIVVERAL